MRFPRQSLSARRLCPLLCSGAAVPGSRGARSPLAWGVFSFTPLGSGAPARALAGWMEKMRPKAGGYFDKSGAGCTRRRPRAGAVPGTFARSQSLFMPESIWDRRLIPFERFEQSLFSRGFHSMPRRGPLVGTGRFPPSRHSRPRPIRSPHALRNRPRLGDAPWPRRFLKTSWSCLENIGARI